MSALRENTCVITFAVEKVIHQASVPHLFGTHLDDVLMEIEAHTAHILRAHGVGNNAVGIQISLRQPTPDDETRITEAVAAANDITVEELTANRKKE